MAEKEIKLMKGNEVIAHAAIRYGCDAYFGYPITPQSEVMETLMELKPWETTGMVVLQAESEISSINMVYGGAATGKRVGIIGGGPGGLTAAYYLSLKGHRVTIVDAMPKMGGMLRYGIPEYRLPKRVLDEEIDEIASLGVEMKNNFRIGVDATFEEFKSHYDAVVVAIGAWSSMPIGCPGEDLEGVLGGIDFLQRVALGERPKIGRAHV